MRVYSTWQLHSFLAEEYGGRVCSPSETASPQLPPAYPAWIGVWKERAKLEDVQRTCAAVFVGSHSQAVLAWPHSHATC